MKHRLSVPIVALALSGCATAPAPAPADSSGARDDYGLAIVSLTLSGKPLERVSHFEYRLRAIPSVNGGEVKRTPHFNSVRQHARWLTDGAGPRAGAVPTRVAVKASGSGVMPDVVESGLPIGRLVVLRLPAGDYELHDWKVVEPTVHGRDELAPRQGPVYRFTVEPGRAAYLGSLDLRLAGEGAHHLSVAAKAQRDLALLPAKGPAVRVSDVVYRPGALRP
ncbi:hypothetical protein CJ010_10860 [Azoarcus sp. DD4]|uniref:hypothetical protein n=1 Tax=Azoarcus sp. DD4 TaxID=2027405 RepID=UPI00112CBEFB|nr:hypothetical protein [Azoarcus sp. DD4]QDF96991.1 hypothetical protein CJ010_10860 [Azoarcus sp. DD4]